jgi:hypothetical protein
MFRAGAADAVWWKGNLHTHSLWSDGDEYPEMVTAWYQEHGYQFLALSDHNRMLAGEHWINASTNKGGPAALEKYVAKFGTNWVMQRERNGQREVRLKTLEDFRKRFEQRDRFLMIPGEEISDQCSNTPIHLNASNLRELIMPQGGRTPAEVIQRDVSAVLEQRKKAGQLMIPHINHPNFQWALTAEDIEQVRGDRFLEIYNGHPITRNNGDTNHPSAERIWDIVLTHRLAEFGLEPMWGTAVDDAHAYHQMALGESNPGRGWIVVRASQLSAPALLEAMENGDFYASSGVRLRDVRRDGKQLAIEIEPDDGATYRTEFIGTRKGYEKASEPVTVEGQPIHATRRYSKDIGTVFATVNGTSPSYTLKGDEIYVRARVVSSRPKPNPMVDGEFETAWVQPVITGTK